MTYVIQNGSIAKSWGGEISGFYRPLKSWRLRGGFTYFAKNLRAKPGHDQNPSYLGNDVKHQIVLQSVVDLPLHFKFDVVGRYLDYIPSSFATNRIPEYAAFDVRLAWTLRYIEFSLTAQNLVAKGHLEFQAQEIPRSVYGKITYRF